MKLALIALGLLATSGTVYAACMFCWSQDRMREKARPQSAGPFLCGAEEDHSPTLKWSSPGRPAGGCSADLEQVGLRGFNNPLNRANANPAQPSGLDNPADTSRSSRRWNFVLRTVFACGYASAVSTAVRSDHRCIRPYASLQALGQGPAQLWPRSLGSPE